MVTTEITVPKNATAALVLADGKVFFGKGIGKHGTTFGEICFNTGLTGYQEVLTDLSYAGQIITFTFPHIGNVGTNTEDIESVAPVARGLVIREDITSPSNFRSDKHLNEWLAKNKITGIAGIDTRALTRHIRLNGAQNVAICNFDNPGELDLPALQKQVQQYPSLNGMELAEGVSCNKTYESSETAWKLGEGHGKQSEPKYKVVAIDYGAKLNIMRHLADFGCDVTIVPAKTSAGEILALNPDGIFLSNGPGDPAATGKYAISVLQKLIASDKPVFGICLGHQLLALAMGCTTTKMHQGHRGSNHPVMDLATGKVEITSQNHGFMVNKDNLPADVEITHLSLFDDSIEGIKSKSKPVFSVQYHPESSPGPHDSRYLFERFISLMEVVNGQEIKKSANHA
ncbi:MAG: Carbamoyl-phosphate synthase small chain [Rickettsiaceae bacterium]|jgi:carbamoyl-phosphate synthase small subunit|nr:Carbamoyl-phosphate synthase small chain [Rickettsiaceae bacterium]